MKNVVLRSLVLALSLSPFATAQVSVTWSRVHDAPPGQSDTALDLAADASGNVWITGRSYNTTSGFPPPPPTADIETVKYDAAGTFQWRARYHSPLGGDDVGYAVAVAPLGSVVVAGQSAGYVGSTYVTQQTVVKYDASGVQLWANQYGPTAGPNVARALLVDSTGNIFVGGNDGGGNASGDMCVRKLDSSGNVIWTAAYDGAAGLYDYVYALALAPNGDVVAVGSTGTPATNTTDLALIRVSSTGTLLWAREVDGGVNGADLALAVAVDSAGHAYVGGQWVTGVTGLDQVLRAYDSAGNLSWSRSRDGSAHGSDTIRRVAVSGAGRILAMGSLTESGSGTDFSLEDFTSAGVGTWVRTWGGIANLDDTARALVVDGLGNAFVVGHSNLAISPSTIAEGRLIAWDPNGLQLFSAAFGNGTNSERFVDVEAGPSGSLLVGGYHDQGIANGLDYLAVRFDPSSTSFCSGDGTGTACPCGNTGTSGRGCASSSVASGARLFAIGNAGASAATDTLALTATDIPGPGLFFQGTGTFGGGAGVTFGDGLLCAGGTITRLGVVFPTSGVATFPGGLTPNPIHAAGGTTAGDVRHYQCWYRDAATFCTSSTFNLTQGVTISWGS